MKEVIKNYVCRVLPRLLTAGSQMCDHAAREKAWMNH
jgi:hypothetical protein